jgi:hypothetical protein
MATETIKNIIFGVMFFLLFAGMLAYGLRKTRLAKIAYFLMGSGWLLLLLIDIFGTTDSFRLGMDNVESNKYNIPLIDSTMQLFELDNDKRVYVTTNYKWNDSTAFHYRKEVSTNIFGIYKITDEFINRKAGKSLFWIFNTTGVFRDSGSVFYLQTLGDMNNSTNDTINKSEAVKMLKDWQVYNKTFLVYKGIY